MLPENYAHTVQYQEHQRRMLSEEPEQALYESRGRKGGPKESEEEKFDKGEDFDKDYLTKKFPSLAMPNIKNKEEIDVLGDLFEEAPPKEESKVASRRREDSRERKKKVDSRSGSRDRRRKRSDSRENNRRGRRDSRSRSRNNRDSRERKKRSPRRSRERRD